MKKTVAGSKRRRHLALFTVIPSLSAVSRPALSLRIPRGRGGEPTRLLDRRDISPFRAFWRDSCSVKRGDDLGAGLRDGRVAPPSLWPRR